MDTTIAYMAIITVIDKLNVSINTKMRREWEASS